MRERERERERKRARSDWVGDEEGESALEWTAVWRLLSWWCRKRS